MASTGSYCAGVEIDGGLLIGGHGPLDLQTSAVVRGSIEEETRLTLNHIGKVLHSAGYNFADVVKCTSLLGGIRDFRKFDKSYSEFFTGVRPVRTNVQSGLIDGIKVEIDAIARKTR